MIKKKLVKIIMIILLIITLFNNSYVYADDAHEEEQIQIEQDLQDPASHPDLWKPTVTAQPELTNKAGTVLGIINTIGVILSVIILAIVGVKYMLGSVEEKADYKKDMIPYIVGAFFLAFATTIPNIIYDFVKNAIK